MSNIPCKNCIVFAMCKIKVNGVMNGSRLYKNEVISLYKEDVIDFKRPYEVTFAPKCSILKDWINEYPYEYLDHDRKRSECIDIIKMLFKTQTKEKIS